MGRAVSIKRGAILLGVLAVVVVLVNLIVGLPILKTAGYRALIQQYAHAKRVAPTGTDDNQLKWDTEIRISNEIRARLQARKMMDMVRLRFPGELEPRPLYEYEDYSTPLQSESLVTGCSSIGVNRCSTRTIGS
jgi:hypothetical protein